MVRKYYYFQTMEEAQKFVNRGEENQFPNISYKQPKELQPGQVKGDNGEELRAVVEVTTYSFD